MFHQHQPNAMASKLPELWNVPLQNFKFTGREKQLAEIEQSLSVADVSIVACVGFGGVGKTYLVLEYIYKKLKLGSRWGSIAWFTCNDKKSLTKQFIRFGQKLGLLTSAHKDEQLLSDEVGKLKTWLEEDRQPGWLLVFDNAVNYEDISYMLPCKGSNVIITSRYTVWDNVVHVGPFERFESIEYLRENCKRSANDDEWSKLANILGDLPLALGQARAYLNENAVLSVSKYLETLASRKRSFFTSTIAGPSKILPVFLNWDITLEISKQSQLGPVLLRSLALLAPNNIPNDIFEDFVEIFDLHGNKLESIVELFEVLHRYSLIVYNKEEQTSSMHSLFQEVVRMKMIEEKDIDVLKKTMILMRLWLKKKKHFLISQEKLQQLVPHIESLYAYGVNFATYVSGKRDDLKRMSNVLLFHIGEIYFYLKDFKKSFDVTNENIKLIEEDSNSQDFTGSIKAYNDPESEVVMKCLVGKLIACASGSLKALEGLVNDINGLSKVDILITLTSAFSKLNNKFKCQKYLKQVTEMCDTRSSVEANSKFFDFIYKRKHEDREELVTMRNELKYSILLKNLDLQKFKKQQEIFKNTLQFLSQSKISTNPLRKCCVFMKAKKVLRRGYFYDKKNPIFMEIFQKDLNERIYCSFYPNLDVGNYLMELRDLDDAKAHFLRQLKTTTEFDYCKIPLMCSLAVINYQSSDTFEVGSYFEESLEIINKVDFEYNERLFEARQALGDAYFLTNHIVKAREAYMESLNAGFPGYDPNHFYILKARLSLYMISYIIDSEDSTFNEIKKIFDNDTTVKNELFELVSINILQYAYNAFNCDQERVAVQCLKDLLHLNYLFYSLKQVEINLNKEALHFIAEKGGKHFFKIKLNFDSNNYSVHLNVSELWVLFDLINTHSKNLPGTYGIFSIDHFRVICTWSGSIQVTIYDKSAEFCCSFLRIMRLIPLKHLNRYLLLLRKGEILCNLNEYESAEHIFQKLLDLRIEWANENLAKLLSRLRPIFSALKRKNKEEIKNCLSKYYL